MNQTNTLYWEDNGFFIIFLYIKIMGIYIGNTQFDLRLGVTVGYLT